MWRPLRVDVRRLGTMKWKCASLTSKEVLDQLLLSQKDWIFGSNSQLRSETHGSATCDVCSALRLKRLDDGSVSRLGLVVGVEEERGGGSAPRLLMTGQYIDHDEAKGSNSRCCQ